MSYHIVRRGFFPFFFFKDKVKARLILTSAQKPQVYLLKY